jgi:hypothetical protein
MITGLRAFNNVVTEVRSLFCGNTSYGKLDHAGRVNQYEGKLNSPDNVSADNILPLSSEIKFLTEHDQIT